MTTPLEQWDSNRGISTQDMWDYSPYLREIAHGNILEIGTRDGVSTAAFLLGVKENGGHVYSVDIDPRCKDLWSDPEDQWTFILADSVMQPEIVKKAIKEPVDVLFIDGDHYYECVKTDLENYVSLVREGGLILMHDVEPNEEATRLIIENNWFPIDGPQRAYDEFISQHLTWKAEIKSGQFGLGVIVKGSD